MNLHLSSGRHRPQSRGFTSSATSSASRSTLPLSMGPSFSAMGRSSSGPRVSSSRSSTSGSWRLPLKSFAGRSVMAHVSLPQLKPRWYPASARPCASRADGDHDRVVPVAPDRAGPLEPVPAQQIHVPSLAFEQLAGPVCEEPLPLLPQPRVRRVGVRAFVPLVAVLGTGGEGL